MSAIDPPEQKKHGCFFYGCITSLAVLFVIVVVGIFAVRYFANKINAKIAEYTETSPMVFPKMDMPTNELKQLKARVAAFNKAVDAHTNTPPLVLTGPEINALLANDPDFKEFKDKCYVEIQGDQVKGEVSLPLEKYFRIPLLHFKGRYLNGSGTFKVGVTNQKLSVYVKSLEVKGKPLPEEFMAPLRDKDMAEEMARSQTNAAARRNSGSGLSQNTNAASTMTNTANMSRYESIVVKDGQMTIKAKEN